MPCKMETRKRVWKLQETVASENTHLHKKTKYAWTVEAHESSRRRLESTLPRNHEGHIAEKGFNSLTHCNLGHKFIPMPQAMKNPDAKAAVDKEWNKLETVPAWALEEVKSKKKAVLEAQRDKGKSTLLHWWTCVTFKKRGVRTHITKIQRTSRAQRRHS